MSGALFPNLVGAIGLRLSMIEPARKGWRCEALPSSVSPDDAYEINMWCVIETKMIYGYTFAIPVAALDRDHDPQWVSDVSALAAAKMRRMLATMN